MTAHDTVALPTLAPGASTPRGDGMGVVDARPVSLHPVTLRFNDPVLEAGFVDEWNRRSLVQVRAATLLGMIMYGLFALVDLAVVPETLAVTWLIRFGVVIPAATGLLLASRTAWGSARLQPLTWGVGVTGGMGIVAMTVVAGSDAQVLYSAGVLLVTAYLGTFTRLRFVPAVSAIGAMVLVYLVSLVAWSGMPLAAGLSIVAFLLAMALVSGTAAYGLERTSRVDHLRRRIIEQQAAHLARALADVRELSGLIPICAWCKRIRDDDGYWCQLESWFSDHSRASFSHGMCPECYARQDDPVEPAATA